MKERRPDRCHSFHSFIVITLSEITFFLPQIFFRLRKGRSSYTLYLLPELSCVMRVNEVSRNFVEHLISPPLLFRCRHSVQFSLHCAWLLQSYSVDANLSTKKKSQGGRENNLYFAPKISDANIEPFWHSYQYPHPPLTPLSCLLWISANFAFKENWANFIQTNSNESWTQIISGTRLRNLILSGELVPKDLSPSSGGADDWKTSFQGRYK